MGAYDAVYDYWDEIAEFLDGSYEVEACSSNSGNCYYLEADIDGGEIEILYFPNGGYIYLYGADVDSDGDAEGYDDDDYWTLEVDEDDIYEATVEWADYNGITLE